MFGRRGHLPLTMFSGSDQLKTVSRIQCPSVGLARRHPDRENAHLRCQPGQRIRRGPIFPSLSVGNGRGARRPGVPQRAARTGIFCLLAAVPGSVAPAPFSMVLMAAFLTQVGALQTAPILIAVVTALLTMEGVSISSPSANSRAQPRRTDQPRRTGHHQRMTGPDLPTTTANLLIYLSASVASVESVSFVTAAPSKERLPLLQATIDAGRSLAERRCSRGTADPRRPTAQLETKRVTRTRADFGYAAGSSGSRRQRGLGLG